MNFNTQSWVAIGAILATLAWLLIPWRRIDWYFGNKRGDWVMFTLRLVTTYGGLYMMMRAINMLPEAASTPAYLFLSGAMFLWLGVERKRETRPRPPLLLTARERYVLRYADPKPYFTEADKAAYEHAVAKILQHAEGEWAS